MADPKIVPRITGTTFKSELWPSIIEGITSCKYYAYIFHDSDIDEKTGELKGKHIHFCAEGRHNVNTWAKLLGVEPNVIEIPRVFRSVNRYLIHIDDPDKAQYDKSLVITNKPLKFESFLSDNQEVKPIDLYYDLLKVKKGVLLPSDFIEKYQFYIFSLPFSQQFKIFTELTSYERE